MASPSKKQKVANTGTDVLLNTGARMPLVGLGTYLSKPGEVGKAVKAALLGGYRHIDCAKIYENEKEIGEAMTEVFSDPKSGVKREEVFVTSKLWTTDMAPKDVKEACVQTLKDLQLSYLDLYLVHLPTPVGQGKALKRSGFGLFHTWSAMEALVDAGLVKAIGVSNYNSSLINDLQNYARIMPAVNQIELNPFLVQAPHRAFLKELGIVVTAFASLGASETAGKEEMPLLEHPVVKELAGKYKRTPGQILLRWAVQQDIVVIPKSTNPSRIQENKELFDFSLAPEDMSALSALDRSKRVFTQAWHGVPTFEVSSAL